MGSRADDLASRIRTAADDLGMIGRLAANEPIRDEAGRIIDLRVVYQSDAARGTVTGSARSVVGKTWREIYPAEVIDNATAMLNELAVGAVGDLLLMTWPPPSDESADEVGGRYRRLIESANDGILVIDAAGTTTLANEAAARMVGVSLERIVGNSAAEVLFRLVPEQERETFDRRFSHRADAPTRYELHIVRPDGTDAILGVSRAPYFNADGSFDSSITLLSDLTEQRRAEAARTRLEAELRQSQKLEAVGRLAGGLAHDFNNMLTVINGCTQFLLQDLHVDDPRREDAEQIQAEVARAASLTRQLLAFSRSQAVNRETLPLNDVVADMERLLGRLIGADVELSVLMDAEPGLVEGDRGQLEQVIVNLVVNARDAMPQGGKLVLQTADVTVRDATVDPELVLDSGDYVMLTVRDTGVGMNAETRSRIFEPFFTTKDVNRGTGLGLSVVFGIVEQSGGRISVYSEEGRGTTFKVYFPASAERSSRSQVMDPATPSATGTERILLIEDDDALRRLVARTLRSGGYAVVEAASAADGRRVLAEDPEQPDLVLSDVIMPGVSGVDLVSELVLERPELPFVLMSGLADAAVIAHLRSTGRVSYIEKPFTSNDLLSIARMALDS
jgi:two-component system cell cycle sensor histidine kinase/response regulator CckA